MNGHRGRSLESLLNWLQGLMFDTLLYVSHQYFALQSLASKLRKVSKQFYFCQISTFYGLSSQHHCESLPVWTQLYSELEAAVLLFYTKLIKLTPTFKKRGCQVILICLLNEANSFESSSTSQQGSVPS